MNSSNFICLVEKNYREVLTYLAAKTETNFMKTKQRLKSFKVKPSRTFSAGAVMTITKLNFYSLYESRKKKSLSFKISFSSNFLLKFQVSLLFFSF